MHRIPVHTMTNQRNRQTKTMPRKMFGMKHPNINPGLSLGIIILGIISFICLSTFSKYRYINI